MAQFTIYRSDDSGSPVLDGQTGSLVNVLDGVLVNGYTASVTSITRAGATATVTTATNHGLNTGNSTTIAGANEGDYNGTFVVTVTGLTTFTYTVPGAPASPATGTITWKKLAAGWAKAFPGASKAAYRAPTGNRLYLRVQDDGPGAGSFAEARITGYETMSNVDTGLNPFPTAAQGVGGIAMLVVRKSTALSATARTWVIAADERTMYMFVFTGDQANSYYGWMFGEFFSFKTNDPWNTMIVGRIAENSGVNGSERMAHINNQITAQTSGHFMARGHTETVGSVNLGLHSDVGKQAYSANVPLSGFIPYTNPEDGILYLGQVWVTDAVTIPVNGLRGRMRGFWCIMHPFSSLANGDTVNGAGSGELTGKSFLFLKFGVNGGLTNAQDSIYTLETSNTLETN
jgi:hypothetical protein